jgi:hypothetical protein
VQQDDALLRAVALGRGLEHVDQPHERDVEPEDGVLAVVELVLEEVVADELLLGVGVLLGAVADDHVVATLVGVARDLGLVLDDGEVLLERPLPGELPVQVDVVEAADLVDHRGVRLGHRCFLWLE